MHALTGCRGAGGDYIQEAGLRARPETCNDSVSVFENSLTTSYGGSSPRVEVAGFVGNEPRHRGAPTVYAGITIAEI